MDEYARRRGIPPADYVDGIDKQALVPGGAHMIFPVGTAPGLVVPWEDTTVVVLPGPPAELAQMWPIVEQHPAATALRAGERLERSLLRVFGVSESVVAHAFAEAGGDEAGTTTTICARRAEVEILVRAPASASDARLRLVDGMRERLGADVFSEDERPLEELVLDAARARGATIATAESCTAGLVAARLTDIAGSSDVVVGGVVAYANEIKQALLGVPAALLERTAPSRRSAPRRWRAVRSRATGAQLGDLDDRDRGAGRGHGREARRARVPALRLGVRRPGAAGRVPGRSHDSARLRDDHGPAPRARRAARSGGAAAAAGRAERGAHARRASGDPQDARRGRRRGPCVRRRGRRDRPRPRVRRRRP